MGHSQRWAYRSEARCLSSNVNVDGVYPVHLESGQHQQHLSIPHLATPSTIG